MSTAVAKIFYTLTPVTVAARVAVCVQGVRSDEPNGIVHGGVVASGLPFRPNRDEV